MAVRKKFTDTPLQVVAEPGMRARIEKVADDEGISMAQVIREILDEGIAKREKVSHKRVAAMTPPPVVAPPVVGVRSHTGSTKRAVAAV